MTDDDRPLVLVTHTLPQEWLSILEPHCRMVFGPTDATTFDPTLQAHLPDADGLFTLLTIRVDANLLDRAPRLRVVSNMAVGVDNIDLALCTRRGIPVGNTPGVLTDGTADLTMALMLALARKLVVANHDARMGRWTTWSPTGWLGADLDGSTLGIVGAGKIGKAVAERARGFGLKLIYTDPERQPDFETRLNAVFMPLTDLLRASDFVSLHVPLTSKTRGMINADTLQLMKPTALLVNTSRGPVVETDSLFHALKEGWLAAAALDVTDPEPLPPEHPLFSLTNCLIVPHIGSATYDTRRKMALRASENLLAGLEGRRVPFCANPEVYDKVS